MSYEQESAFVIGMLIVYFLIFLVIFVGMLIATGIPLYKMAKNSNIKNPWLAFVPIGNTYILCVIPSKKFKVFNVWETENRTQVFLTYILLSFGIGLVTAILSFIPCLGSLVAIAASAVLYIYSYFMYENLFATYYEQHDTIVLWSILSILVPIAGIVGLYITMNKPRIDNDTFKTEINTNYDL